MSVGFADMKSGLLCKSPNPIIRPTSSIFTLSRYSYFVMWLPPFLLLIITTAMRGRSLTVSIKRVVISYLHRRRTVCGRLSGEDGLPRTHWQHKQKHQTNPAQLRLWLAWRCSLMRWTLGYSIVLQQNKEMQFYPRNSKWKSRKKGMTPFHWEFIYIPGILKLSSAEFHLKRSTHFPSCPKNTIS